MTISPIADPAERARALGQTRRARIFRRVFWSVVMVLFLAVPVSGAILVGCYPMPPVNPPSCAQDPNQEWCAPPAFQKKIGCSTLKVTVDVDAGVMDDAGVWRYPSHATMAPCTKDGGAR